MSLFRAGEAGAIDPQVLEQGLAWMVTLQSGVCSAADQQACLSWRNEHPQHERVWQRLNGLSRDLRAGAGAMPAEHVRSALQARSLATRRGALKALVGVGVLACGGWQAREHQWLAPYTSDYATATGERRALQLGSHLAVQLDTRTALDVAPSRLVLDSGRLWLSFTGADALTVRTRDVSIKLAGPARLVVSRDLPEQPASLVQVLSGQVQVASSTSGAVATLAAGQGQAFALGGSAAVTAVNTTAEAWTRGLLVAERMPLVSVARQLDRYRRGILRCDSSVAQLRVSGSFSIDNPEASLDLLTRLLPVKVNRVLGYWATLQAA